MDSLHRLKYVSTPHAGLDEAQLRNILKSARQHNAPRGLTGFLAFSPEHFLQVLEGGRAALTECFMRIARDERHHSVVLLSFEAIQQRDFCDWSMGYMALGPRHQSVLMRYSADGTLKPMALQDPSLMMLLRELACGASEPRQAPAAVPSPAHPAGITA
jgi:Sensors of blue-light using FAD